MTSYQTPSRTIENVFCRREPAPKGCADSKDSWLFDPDIPNVPVSSMQVKVSGQGENAGRGVYTTVDIENGTYIAPETYTSSLRFFPSTHELIVELFEDCPKQAYELETIEYYMYGYGFSSRIFVSDFFCPLFRLPVFASRLTIFCCRAATGKSLWIRA